MQLESIISLGRRINVDRENISFCKDWITNNARKVKSVGGYNSYALKHIIEAWDERYVTEDEFIIASLELGFDYRVVRGNATTLRFNMSVPGWTGEYAPREVSYKPRKQSVSKCKSTLCNLTCIGYW